MNNPFSKSNWSVELSTMGFQSLVYDENGRLIASVEPTDPNQPGPSHEQIARLIMNAPLLLAFAEGMLEIKHNDKLALLMNSIISSGLQPTTGSEKL